MKPPDASTASAATSTTASSAGRPTRASTAPLPWLSMSPLHQTHRPSPPKSPLTSPPPGNQKPLFRIREPVPKFSKPRTDPPLTLVKPAVSSLPAEVSGIGFHIREHLPDPSGKLSKLFVSSGRGFTHIREPRPDFAHWRKFNGSVSTDQTVTQANIVRQEAQPVVRSAQHVRPPPLRPSVHKRNAPDSLPQLQDKSRLSSAKGAIPSASPKIVPPSSSAECRDFKKKRERSKVETFIVVRDRKVRMTEDASLYQLCRSWLRNGYPEKNYQLPHENYPITLPKPLPHDVVDATRPVRKEDNGNEKQSENEEESVDLTIEDLLKEHVMHGKKFRARLREERQERISRYGHRLILLLHKQDEPSDHD